MKRLVQLCAFVTLCLGLSPAYAAPALPTAAPADKWAIVDGGAGVTFHAEATPGFLSIDGKDAKGGQLAGEVFVANGALSGTLKIKLAGYKTGIGLRDRHMHGYLDTGKYPEATLTLDGVAFKESGKVDFCAKLKVKLETGKVCGTYELFSLDGNRKRLQAVFALDLKNYPSIGTPAYTGTVLSDTIDVLVDAQVAKL
jgi:polyisoprenoid-binding protein YceI